MTKRVLFSAFACLVVFLTTHSSDLLSQSVHSSSLLPSLPVTPVKPVTDNYYGTKASDPYRYMENLKDPEVQSWMKAQNNYTRAVLARIPGRQELLGRIRELDQSVSRVWADRLPSDLYLIGKRLPTEDVYKVYLRRGLDGNDNLLVDPQKIKLTASNQGKGKNTIEYSALSRDGNFLAVGIAPGGSEHDTEIHILETASGRNLGDVILRAHGGDPSWLPDNHSFVYGKLQKLPPDAPVTEEEQKYRAYLHVLGADPEKDSPVFGYGVVASINVGLIQGGAVKVQPDSAYALGILDNGGVTPNRAFYIEPVADVGKTNSAWRKVADFSDDVSEIRVHGDELYLLTYKNAPRYKVLRMNAHRLDWASAETVVPASQAVVTYINAAHDALYVEMLDGGIGRVLRVPYGSHPQMEEVALPFKGSAYANTDPRLAGALLSLTSWTEAFKIYNYNPETKQVTDTKLQPLGPFDHAAGVESVEVKVPSYDGTMVPLSITHRKGLSLNGTNPTLLAGYGAYGNPFSPQFQSTLLAWYEKGGVYSVCHVRGGGEYGEEWHLAGKQATKPNTWRDFIACAQYLIGQKYTSAAHLAGQGISAGGILIGRAIAEQPDLFRAAIDSVGLSDMLRVETTANGVVNVPEFGSTKTEDGFKSLYAMSAYGQIKDQTAYPAVLLETGYNDPRVDPWQSAKMTARLQAATASGKPVLLRVEYEGGHGSIGGTERQTQERLADEWSFLLWQFGEPGFQLKP